MIQNVSILSLARQSKSNVSDVSRDSIKPGRVLEQRLERNGSRRPTKNLSIDLTGEGDDESDVICITSVVEKPVSPRIKHRCKPKCTREEPQLVESGYATPAGLIEVNDDALSDLTMR